MPRAIVIKEGVVLLQPRKVGEIIERITHNDIYRFREFVRHLPADYPLSAGETKQSTENNTGIATPAARNDEEKTTRNDEDLTVRNDGENTTAKKNSSKTKSAN